MLPEPPADYPFEAGGFLDVDMGLPHGAEPPYYTTPICDKPFAYFIINHSYQDTLFMGEYAFVE